MFGAKVSLYKPAFLEQKMLKSIFLDFSQDQKVLELSMLYME